MLITPEEISRILGSPLANVQLYYPKIIEYLNIKGANKVSFQVALLATIGVESGTFKPVREGYWIKDAIARPLFNRKYSNRKDLGNLGGDDGWRYRGGGFVQLTGRHNYRKYGKLIGADLENHPELILSETVSTATLVEYGIDHGLDVWAARAYNEKDQYEEDFCWHKVRLLVNGDPNDKWVRFKKSIVELKKAAVT